MKNIKIIILLFSIAAFYSSILFSQEAECLMDHFPLLKSSIVGCSSQDLWTTVGNDDYEPDENSITYVVKINFHIMQTAQGTGNFQEDNQDHIYYLNKLVTHMNDRLKILEAPQYGGPTYDTYIPNSKIQFSLEGIYFHRDNRGITNDNETRCGTSRYCYDNYGINKDGELNIFWCQISKLTTGSCGPGLWGENTNFIISYNKFDSYLEAPGWTSQYAIHFVHEIGHCLGLYHTFQPDELNDTYFPEGKDWCEPLSDTHCSNNIMSYSKDKRYLSPGQIGKMRRLLTENWRSKLLKICDKVENTVINTSETWETAHAVFGDIIVNDELKIQCRVNMPSNGLIEVNSGGILELDDGYLYNNCNSYVDGIVVHNGGLLKITNARIINQTIRVENGGTLIINENIDGIFEISENGKVIIEENAYLCIEQGTPINLKDEHSLIQLYPTSNIGVNPAIPETGNCISDVVNMPYTGNGSINVFNSSSLSAPIVQTSDQNKIIVYSDNAEYYTLVHENSTIISTSYNGIFNYDDIPSGYNKIYVHNSYGTSSGFYVFTKYTSDCSNNLSFYNNNDLLNVNYATYSAANTITAENLTINNGKFVVFKAGNSIRLKKPFYVDGKSSLFHGYIDDCSNTSTSSVYKKSGAVKQQGTTDEILEKTTEQGVNIPDEQQVSIFPNPTYGKFNISLTIPAEYVQVCLYNMNGSMFYQKDYFNTNNIDIDISNQAKGIVMVKIITNEGVYNQMVIFQY